jgi:hypothetical protein
MPGLFSVNSLTEIRIVSITNRELWHYAIIGCFGTKDKINLF